MDLETLEKIKDNHELLRKNAIQYLTEERNVYEKSALKEKDTYDLFALFLTAYLPRLHKDVNKEASCLSAAITTQMALSLGWMNEHFQLLSKEIKGTIWGRTLESGAYRKFTYNQEEQQEITAYINKNLAQ